MRVCVEIKTCAKPAHFARYFERATMQKSYAGQCLPESNGTPVPKDP